MSAAGFYLSVGQNAEPTVRLPRVTQSFSFMNLVHKGNVDFDSARGFRMTILYDRFPDAGKRFLKVQEIADRLDISPKLVTLKINAGDLGPAVQPFGCERRCEESYRMRDVDVDAFGNTQTS